MLAIVAAGKRRANENAIRPGFCARSSAAPATCGWRGRARPRARAAITARYRLENQTAFPSASVSPHPGGIGSCAPRASAAEEEKLP